MEIPTAAILKNPDLYEKVKNDLRYSDDGMSRNEAQEYERTRDERNRADIDAAASARRTVQEAGEKAERIRDGLRTQFEALGHKKVGKREAEFYSTIWTAALANEARYAGVDIEEMARWPEWNLRFQYDRGTGDISMMQDVYTQPVNAGVDLGQKVPILDLSGMEGTSTPKELLARLKDMALNGETWISRDTEVFATLPKGKKLKHVAYSSRKAQIDGVMALTRRNSVAGSLDDLVQNAVLIESTPNNDPKKTDVLNFHRLYVPVRTGAGVQAVRIVAEELKNSDRLRPTEVEIYDVVLEGQKESLGVPNDLLAKEGVTAPGAPFELTIADMLRGVKDAEGRPYVGEEYRQSSARQSEEYDPGDPKTWPEGPARDEALELEAWQNLENDDEPETWPESPEKTEALALRKEYGEIEAWVESHTVEEVLANDELNERGVAIEKRLRDLRKELRKKKPKGAERRLLQLIETEEEAAAREAETYYQTAYHGSPHQFDDFDLGQVGGGAGTQWQGWGGYLSSRKKIADWYRLQKISQRYGNVDIKKDLKIDGVSLDKIDCGRAFPDYNPSDVRHIIAQILPQIKNEILRHKDETKRLRTRAGMSWVDFVKHIPDMIDRAIWKMSCQHDYMPTKFWDDLSDFLISHLTIPMTGEGKAGGQLYKVNIPDHDVLMDWEAPLAEQPKSVIKALKNIGAEVGIDFGDDWTGEQVYKAISKAFGEPKNAFEARSVAGNTANKRVSELFLRHQIPGLKYLDEYSEYLPRDKGTHNYVIWDKDAIKIEETYYQKRAPLTFKLTGKSVSGEYMAALEKLESGEPVTAEEYDAIPEIQDARSRTATGSTLGMPGREPIRKQVYDKLMSYGSAVTEVVDGRERTVYNGEVRNDRRADIIIGLPASGKSSALVDPISSKYKSMLIDSDEAKGLIPEFDDGFGAGFVHEESKWIVTTVLSDVTDEGKNIVVPIVGSDYIKLKRLYIDGLRQKGYKVYVHMADIDPNVAAGRNLRRFAETGRFVDLEATSFKYGNKPREVFERVKKEGIADGYSRIDTTVFPGRWVEGTEDISHDRGDLRERRGRSLSDVHAPGEGESSQAGAAGGTAAGLGAERAGGTSREGMAPRSVSGRTSDINARLTVQPGGVSLIEFFKSANKSTSFHELAHHMFRVIYELSGRDGVDPQLIEDVNTILREAGVTREEFDSDNAEVRKAARTRVHEFFAEGFEVYISEGKAPSKELRGVFRRLRAWMIEVYHDVVQALGIELSDEMRGVYDRLLAMPEEIDAETTVRELAVEEAALKEEIQRYEQEAREREAQERISAEGGEEWASLEIPEDAMEAVDGWLSELESYEIGRAARAEVRKTLDYIREEGGLNFDRLVHLMGDEAAGELKKKLGNFYFTSKKALAEGRGLPLDVLAEALGLDENGLVAFLEGIEGGKLKKPAPLLEVNTDTLNALIDRLGVEGAQAYLKDRARYLTKQQKAIQQEYDKDKGNAQVRADLEATYREQREIADGLRALERTLKAEGDIAPEQVFEPVSLTTESGRSIDEADDSELLLTPDGSTELGRIDEDVAKAAGIAAGEIRANVGAVRHAEEGHGGEILGSGYPDVETFFFDVLSTYERVYRGSNDSLLLTKPLGRHHAVAAIELVNEDGVYRAKTGWTIRERKLNKKELLFARSEPLATDPGADVVSRTALNEDREGAAPTARQKSNSGATVSSGKSDVNPMLSLSEAMRRGYAMAEKYAKAAFKAGREEAAAKARERTQLLKKKLQERQKLKKEVNKLVKGINNMAKSESISWARHKELEKLLADYDLKKRRQEVLDRRAELEEYLKENPEAADTMNAADLKYLGTRTLNDMTLDDLRSLNEQARQIYDRGHEEYKVWDLERTERRDTMHSELVAVLKKRKTNLPKIVTKSEDLKKQYKGVTGKLAKAKDWAYAATLGPDRFFDWLDKGATDYTGAFVRHLVDEVNKQRDVALRHIFERRKWMEDRLRPLGFRMSDFTRIAATVEGQDFTWDDIMEIYIGMRNDKKGRAILYGNLKNMDDPEGTAAYLIGLLSEGHKKAAELVVEDHNLNVGRIEAGLIDAFQKGMDREMNYTSIHRLEHLSSMGLIDAESAEALTDGMADAGVLRRVEDGFMKKRVEIKDENQTPVKLGLFSNWHEDVSRHEHAAAMATTARDIAGALLMRNPVDGQTIGRMVKERFGDEAWRTLVDFVNTNVTDDARLAHSLLDKMSNTLMKNMVIAYLAGNLGTALKQTTSIPRFLITAGPHRILVSIAQFLTQGPKFLENVYELDPQMRDRMGSPILTMLRQDPRWGKRMYQRGLDWMLAPIAMMDRWVAAIGWKATYDANVKRLGHEGAVREAQRAVRLTQQPASAKDAARMWRQNGFVRLAMVFTSDAAQTFGMTAYDLVQQLRSGKLGRAFSTLTALALTGILVKAASEGLPDDEDDEDENRSWVLEAFTEQFISSIPLVGKEAMVLYDNLSGKRRGSQYSAFITPVEKVARAWHLWADEDSDEEEFRRATWLALEAFSLSGVAPIPVTGMRRMVQSMELAEEDGMAAALNMVGIRRRE